MFKNYFKTALRNFWHNKIFSIINVLGLAIGISASLIIFLIINYEFSFDQSHKDSDRIYRVVSEFNFSDQYIIIPGSDPMSKAVQNEIVGLDLVIPFRTWDGGAKLSVPDVPNK